MAEFGDINFTINTTADAPELYEAIRKQLAKMSTAQIAKAWATRTMSADPFPYGTILQARGGIKWMSLGTGDCIGIPTGRIVPIGHLAGYDVVEP